MLNTQSGLGAQSVTFGDKCSSLQAFGSFLVQELGNRGRTALLANAFNYHGVGNFALHKSDYIADFDFFGWFDIKRVDLNVSAINFFGCERPGFEEACRPKPFVNASFFHLGKRVGVM